ncbi:Aste57867_1073 [Aphanomyces stellatus]|uniref:Aste57867_1073 protein n=1 Tax=Aphanomyces stellatus TaxID=120398 RepID=A0A485K9R0_9STRA|nr:hypothetical protein As57867_001072 [Aphanomyces stellatus]VFT78295.1 Aste57867_1073 [Aphanomyces stellatus]
MVRTARSEGHLIPSNHSIGNAATAGKTQFEFGAECYDPNKCVQLGWNGETVPNDFTLVKLRLKAGVLLAKYGCLQAPPARRIRRTHLHPPVPQEQTHVATVLDDGKIDTIESLGLV